MLIPFSKHRKIAKPTPQLITVVSLLLIVVGVSLLTNEKGIDTAALPENIDLPEESLEPTDSGGILTESRPTHIRAPAIGLDTTIIELGVQRDNEIENPKTYKEVGWYKHGPTPGEPGPAVILGHVAAEVGPGIFGYLRLLEPGDLIEIDREEFIREIQDEFWICLCEVRR